jgi:poly(A) polymerase
MMRAVRFATKLGFDIHRDSEKAILRHHAEIGNASPPRLFEEILRLFTVGAAPAFRLLNDLKLMGDLLPAVAAHVKSSGGRRSPLWGLLEAFDAHAEDPLHDDHGLCFATLLYPLFADRLRAAAKAGDNPSPETVAAEIVGDALVNPFAARTWAPPRTVCEAVASILAAQARLDADDPQIRRPRMISRDWFPAAALLWRIRTEASGGDLGRVAELEKAVRKGNRTARALHADFEEGRRPKSERPQPEVRGPKSGRGRPPGGPKPQRSEPQTPKNPAEGVPETVAPQGVESEADQGDATAEQGATPRRRHRRRGGRRHHRGGNAEAPSTGE